MDETSHIFAGKSDLYDLCERTFRGRFELLGDMTTYCWRRESFCRSNADELQFSSMGVWDEQKDMEITCAGATLPFQSDLVERSMAKFEWNVSQTEPYC